jgi:hypothetical protein
MTNYAYEPADRRLLATWGTGVGDVAHVVARLHARTPPEDGLRLARALSWLSAGTWRSYSDPHLFDILPEEALAALREPNRPEGSVLKRSAEPHVEYAHEVGRRLVAIGSAGVTRAVVTEVAEDLAALENALLGDLSGRARQAVELSRLDVSPLQVVAADRLLAEVPLGGERLFTEVDPTAAAVAATHWLRATIDITLARTGLDGHAEVLAAASTFGLEDGVAAQVVLDLLDGGDAPLVAVQCLVRSAMLAARGMVVLGRDDPTGDPDDEARFTVLDPLRPARGLLERLVQTIQSCAFVYLERVDPGSVARDADLARLNAAREVFDRDVRAEAERHEDRLLKGSQPTPAR